MNGAPAGRVAPRLSRWAAPAFVGLATLAVFWPVLGNGFVNWDDGYNYLEHADFHGLGWAQLRWIFSFKGVLGHYIPLSRLAQCLAYSLWGMCSWGHHLTNLLAHTLNAVLFYFVAARLLLLGQSDPGAQEESAVSFAAVCAALIFAIHPLRVESVAWASNTDALCGVFCLAAVLLYLRRGRGSLAAAGCYALSLLAKPLGLALPVVLLILDVYPLRRLPGNPRQWLERRYRRVWSEKILFLALALAAGALELVAKSAPGALVKNGVVFRCEQASFGAAFYVAKTLAPFHLLPLYELPADLRLPLPALLLSVALVSALSLVVVLLRRRWPAGLAVWAGYIVLLLPVLGLFIQSGPQLVADRYTYIPCMGWAVLAGAAVLRGRQRLGPQGRGLLFAALACGLVGLGALTWRQIVIWRDSETLWRYELTLHPDCAFARNNLGSALVGKGNLSESAEHVRQALRINPDYAEAHNNMGLVLAGEGKVEEAVAHYREALRLKPDMAGAHNNWGLALARQGRTEEAVAHYREALRLEPDLAVVHNDLGAALARLGRAEEAAAQYREALRLNPDYSEAHSNLGLALAEQGRAGEAIAQYREALRLKPDMAGGHNNLGLLLAGQGQAEEAVAQYREALRLKPDYLEAHYNLGLLLAGQGKSDEARREFQEALRINPGFALARKNLDVLMRH